MARKDLFEEPFDESTIDKLELFEKYIEEWLPTFTSRKSSISQIGIFDFFAGQGKDVNNVHGSPLRILEKIRKQTALIFGNHITINLHLNEIDKAKYELLVKNCNDYLEHNSELKRVIKLNYYNQDTELLFPTLQTEIKQYPSLVFLDQCGIKFASVYLDFFEKVNTTDFLIFIPTSHAWRLGASPSFQEYLKNIDIEAARKDAFNLFHKKIVDHFKSTLSKNTDLNLYPYTIKDGSKLHGIIFGAKHPRAFDKFLSVTWNMNELNGESNFDIYNDTDYSKLNVDLFGNKRKTKRELFEDDLKQKILSKEIKNNFEAYNYSLSVMHPGQHAKECIMKMKADNLITYKGMPCVTYESVYEKKILVEYKLKR